MPEDELEWRHHWAALRWMMRDDGAFLVDPFTGLPTETVSPEWAKEHPNVMVHHMMLGTEGASKGWLLVDA